MVEETRNQDDCNSNNNLSELWRSFAEFMQPSSRQTDQIDAALFDAKQALANVVKTKKGHTGAYAELPAFLEHIKPSIYNAGVDLLCQQLPHPTGPQTYYKVMLVHVGSGQFRATIYPMDSVLSNGGKPQLIGAQHTYFIRYGAKALLSLAESGDDTDGDLGERNQRRERILHGDKEVTVPAIDADRAPIDASAQGQLERAKGFSERYNAAKTVTALKKLDKEVEQANFPPEWSKRLATYSAHNRARIEQAANGS